MKVLMVMVHQLNGGAEENSNFSSFKLFILIMYFQIYIIIQKYTTKIYANIFITHPV